jgi:hypothetical protein
MIVGRFFGSSAPGLAIAAATLAVIGLTRRQRGPQMQVEAGVGVESAPVPPLASGSELSPSGPCSLTPTTITRITTHTATTHPHPLIIGVLSGHTELLEPVLPILLRLLSSGTRIGAAKRIFPAFTPSTDCRCASAG